MCTETVLETTKRIKEVFGYLHGVENPVESPHGASIGLFRGKRREAQACTRTRIREGWREGRGEREEQEKEKAGRNGISVLRRPTCA